MGMKRGKVRGSFVGDTRQQVFDFYREIVQTLKSWQPRAPKLSQHDDEELPSSSSVVLETSV